MELSWIRTDAFSGLIKDIRFYTIGQRKGLDIAFGKPVYVTEIRPQSNEVVLGDETDLEQNEMVVSQIELDEI